MKIRCWVVLGVVVEWDLILIGGRWVEERVLKKGVKVKIRIARKVRPGDNTYDMSVT